MREGTTTTLLDSRSRVLYDRRHCMQRACCRWSCRAAALALPNCILDEAAPGYPVTLLIERHCNNTELSLPRDRDQRTESKMGTDVKKMKGARCLKFGS